METSYIVDNDKLFAAQLKRLGALTNDFRIPFSLIANDFYKSERQIFKLKGPGLYPDLADSTKRQKVYRGSGNTGMRGEIYPILVGMTGRLAKSLLDRSSAEAVFKVGKKELEMGTDVPYAIFHQSDRLPRLRLPQRKVVFIDGGPLEQSKGAQNGRRERWTNYIEDYIKKILAGEV